MMKTRTLWLIALLMPAPCCVLASACTCRLPATKASAQPDSSAAAASATAAALASASSSASPDEPAPRSWTLAWRKRSLLEVLAQPAPLYASTVLDNGLFEEGPLYLERKDDVVRGILDRTVVVGEVDAGGETILRDAATKQVVFRGKVQGAASVSGAVYAEGERRSVTSVQAPPPVLPEGAWRFEVIRSSFGANSTATLTRRGDQITGKILGAGWAKGPRVEADVKGIVRGEQLALTIGGASLSLHMGPGLLVGRISPGNDVVLFQTPEPALPASTAPRVPQPLSLGGNLAVVPHVYKHKTRFCEVSLAIPELRGPAVASQLNLKLSDEVVDRAMGPGEQGRAAVQPQDLRCERDMGSAEDPWMMDGTYEATDLGKGWLGLRLEGYARVGGARANVSYACVVVDMNRGELLWPAQELGQEQIVLLTDWTGRMLRREARQADLTQPEENMYLDNGAPITKDTPLCFTPDGLRVSFNPGAVTKYLPTVGPGVLIPRRLLPRLFPKGSRLADIAGH